MSAPGRVTFQTGVPVLNISGGLSFKAVFNFGSRRESECDRICEKVENIHRIVADQANYIHPRALALFLDFVNRFVEARMAYYGQRHDQGPLSTFEAQPKSLKWKANKLITTGTLAYREGVAVSTSGSSMRSFCRLYHRDPPKNSEGRCLLCFADLPLLEPKQGAGAFLTWEAYLDGLQRDDILTAMNQDCEVAEGSLGAPGIPNPLNASEMINTTDSSGNYLGLETVSESEIPSMWKAFTSVFTPKRSSGDSARQ